MDTSCSVRFRRWRKSNVAPCWESCLADRTHARRAAIIGPNLSVDRGTNSDARCWRGSPCGGRPCVAASRQAYARRRRRRRRAHRARVRQLRCGSGKPWSFSESSARTTGIRRSKRTLRFSTAPLLQLTSKWYLTTSLK
jgi:hypothetical protein